MELTANDADLKLSFFEYQSSYKEPIFGALTSSAPMAALFSAFKEWNVSLSDISANQSPANAAEYQTTVELLNRRFVFSVGLGVAKLSVTNPNWSEVEQVARIINAGLTAIRSTTDAEISQQTVHLSMHLKPRGCSIYELTSRFISPETALVMSDQPLAYGFSVYSTDTTWIVDLSALSAEVLFVRLSRSFNPNVSLEEIFSSISRDQEKALEALRLRIVESGD
jgi:hypothetical protein